MHTVPVKYFACLIVLMLAFLSMPAFADDSGFPWVDSQDQILEWSHYTSAQNTALVLPYTPATGVPAFKYSSYTMSPEEYSRLLNGQNFWKPADSSVPASQSPSSLSNNGFPVSSKALSEIYGRILETYRTNPPVAPSIPGGNDPIYSSGPLSWDGIY